MIDAGGESLHYITSIVSPIEEYNHTERTRFLSFSQMGEWGAPVVHGTPKLNINPAVVPVCREQRL